MTKISIEKNKSIAHSQDHDLSHSMTHYLLTIHKLKEGKGYARVTDIASEMGLTKGSVSISVGNLRKRGLLKDSENSRFIELTEKGHDEVHHILGSHTLLYYLFKDFLGTGEASAKKDSCLMEHLMSKETMEKLFEFMKTLSEEKNIEMGIDLSRYNTYQMFLDDQKGDSFLLQD